MMSKRAKTNQVDPPMYESILAKKEFSSCMFVFLFANIKKLEV